MDESNWWLYLMGAVAAYVFIPWRTVFKWIAVAVCAVIALAFFVNDSESPTVRLTGGFLFGAISILVARSEYRDADSGASTRKTRGQIPQPYREDCHHCGGVGKVRCLHSLAIDRDARGYSCYECQGSHFKKCAFCNGTGKR